jgi:hypothetical protein
MYQESMLATHLRRQYWRAPVPPAQSDRFQAGSLLAECFDRIDCGELAFDGLAQQNLLLALVHLMLGNYEQVHVAVGWAEQQDRHLISVPFQAGVRVEGLKALFDALRR